MANEPLQFWTILSILTLWRVTLSKWKNLRCLDRIYIQWPIVSLMLLLLALLHAIKNFYYWDWCKLNLLSSEAISVQITEATHRDGTPLADSEKAALEIYPILRWCALVAPIIASLVLLLVSYQVFSLYMCGRIAEEVYQSTERFTPRSLLVSEELTILVIITPAVFIVMAMFALVRAIQTMSGTSLAGQAWEDFDLWHSSTYAEDLACASGFQYVTIFAFAWLCSDLLGLKYQFNVFLTREGERMSLVQRKMEAARSEHEAFLFWAGFQGVWAYIFVGVLRCLINFLHATAALVGLRRSSFDLMAWSHIDAVFMFTSLLCIYNMFIVLQIKEVKHFLGPRATAKFLWARVLLLAVDVQHSILKYASDETNGFFSIHQAHLLQVILLLFECLGVAVWNFFTWTQLQIRSTDSYIMLVA